ncbi:hypothetical protein DENSPDRAFT_223368 [Dentipellis sp. KUC8613]|nr:hypothetical protein DENSPDRAFT_223368 [Dentipellis sp. KUC8613]
MHAAPAHQPSLPAMSTALHFPLEIAALPASTRTSFTRVDHDHTRPTTAAGPRASEDRNDAYSLADEDRERGVEGVCVDERVRRSEGEREGEKEAVEMDEESEGTGDRPCVEEREQRREEPVPQTPQTAVTFLLVSGRRRAMTFEPATTVGRVKELVWNTWPNEWQDERPPAPSYFRILHLGKILQDEDTLTQLKFPSHLPSSPADPAAAPPPNTIVHLSIRACAPPQEPDGFLKKRSRRRSRAPTETSVVDAGVPEAGAGGCCGCVIC